MNWHNAEISWRGLWAMDANRFKFIVGATSCSTKIGTWNLFEVYLEGLSLVLTCVPTHRELTKASLLMLLLLFLACFCISTMAVVHPAVIFFYT